MAFIHPVGNLFSKMKLTRLHTKIVYAEYQFFETLLINTHYIGAPITTYQNTVYHVLLGYLHYLLEIKNICQIIIPHGY